MSEYTENSKRVADFITARPWLFTDAPYLQMDKYIKYFEYGKPSEFHIFPSLLSYRAELLDEFKGKVYNTLFLPTGPSSLGMHTIVQISYDLHIVFVYGNSSDNRATVVYATLHTSDTSEYVKFLKKYEGFVYDENNRTGFFATPVPQTT